MDAEIRRETILQQLRQSTAPVSATILANELGVSRQVIVGDIALLRARGSDITATARGYMMTPLRFGRYVGKVACQHQLVDTERELLAIVELGGEVLDVVVEHSIYGEMTGQLNIATPQDVAAFLNRLRHNESRLLSELTGGIHLHTVSCRDADTFGAIIQALAELGILYTA